MNLSLKPQLWATLLSFPSSFSFQARFNDEVNYMVYSTTKKNLKINYPTYNTLTLHGNYAYVYAYVGLGRPLYDATRILYIEVNCHTSHVSCFLLYTLTANPYVAVFIQIRQFVMELLIGGVCCEGIVRLLDNDAEWYTTDGPNRYSCRVDVLSSFAIVNNLFDRNVTEMWLKWSNLLQKSCSLDNS